MREIKTLELTKEQLDEKYGKDALLEKDGIFELHRDFIGLDAWTNCTPIES